MNTGVVLDMSQAAVNKTAMYNVSWDTHEILRPFCRGVQCFGKRYEEVPSTREIARLRDTHLGALLSDPTGFANTMAARSASAGRDDVPCFYLDPLYTLFAPLSPRDEVMVLDLSTITHPAWHEPHVARAYAVAFERIMRAGPRLIAISQNTADGLYANFGYPPERTEVVPLYVPRHLSRSIETVTPLYARLPYILFVGSLELRKNLIGAVKSFALSGLGHRGYQLIIVGGRGVGEHEIRASAAQTQNVTFAGFVSNEELRSYYAGASAFLYPSYLEGFGVPLLEAMMYGVACVASCTGACPEVGGPLVSFCDPDDHGAIASALIAAVELPPEERRLLLGRSRRWITDNYAFQTYQERILRLFGLPQHQMAAA